MIRPVTGLALSAAARQAKVLNELRDRGGDKVAVLLPPESMEDLRTVIEANGFATRQGKTEAIIHALALAAKAARRKAAKGGTK